MSAKTLNQRRKAAEKNWEKLQDSTRPVIYVGAGSCGRAAGALEVIENIHSDGGMYWEALNIPNAGYIPNLPEGSIVELPGTLNADGAIGRQFGGLPEGIAELIRREISVSHLTVDSVVAGDRQLALQALLLDPVIRDMDLAKLILDDYLTVYRQYLPTFWK